MIHKVLWCFWNMKLTDLFIPCYGENFNICSQTSSGKFNLRKSINYRNRILLVILQLVIRKNIFNLTNLRYFIKYIQKICKIINIMKSLKIYIIFFQNKYYSLSLVYPVTTLIRPTVYWVLILWQARKLGFSMLFHV